MNLVGVGNLKIVQNYCNKSDTIKSGQIVYVQQDPRKTGYSVMLQPIVCEYKFKYRIQTLECGMFCWLKDIIAHMATFLCLAPQNLPNYFMKGHCCLVDGAFLQVICLLIYVCINQSIYLSGCLVCHSYNHTYVFNTLCSMRWLRTLQLREADKAKVIMGLLMNILTRTVNTLPERWTYYQNYEY